MAIKIPSKNIYKIENPKIRDNIVDNVSVEQTVVTPNNEYETPVFNGKYIPNSFVLRNTENRKTVGEIITLGADVGLNGVWIANAEILNQEVSNFIITIPKQKQNKVIQRILYQKDENNKNQIKYTVYGKIRKGNCSRTVGWAMPSGMLINPITANITSVGEITFGKYTEESEETSFDYNSNIVASISGTPNADALFEREVFADLTPIDVSGVVSYNDNESNDTFEISFDVMSKITIVRLGGMDFVPTVSGVLTINGEYETYIPTQIEITIYGNTIGIDLTDGSITYDSGSKPHSLSRNELLQDSGKVGETLLTEHLANNVLNGYAKGKETATLLCSISDYYDYDTNNLAISTKQVDLINYPITITLEKPSLSSKIGIKVNTPCPVDLIVKLKYERELTSGDNYIDLTLPRNTLSIQKTLPFVFIKSGSVEVVSKQAKYSMSFRLHDEVIPMIFGANRQDVPMSKYQNGTPKVFEVVGSNIIYDGAVWQELTLLEK